MIKAQSKQTAASTIAAAIAMSAPSVSTVAQRGSQGYIPQVYQGQEALRDGKWSAAAYHFRTALEWDPKGVDAHIGLGIVYLKSGQPRRAEEQFSVALRLRPHSAQAERGIHLARTEAQEESAFQAIKEQVKNEPANADAHATYAEELLERNQIELARQEAVLALRLNNKEGHAYCALGRIAGKENKDEEARTLLEQAVHLDNTDDDALMLLGDLSMRKKAFKQAASYYRRVVRLVPDESEGHRKLMEALIAIGDAHGAAKEKAAIDRL